MPETKLTSTPISIPQMATAEDKPTVELLTDKEKQLLANERPELLKALEAKSPLAPGWLNRWRRDQILKHAEDQAKELRNDVANSLEKTGEQGNLLFWCGYPTDLTRCSPFFPINSNTFGERKFLQDFVITTSSWGKITYTGPKLSIFEEDVLMVLLAYLERASQERKLVLVKGEDTYSYSGPALPLLRLLGFTRPGKREYKRLLLAFELMSVSGIKMEISAGYTKSGHKRPARKMQIVNIISSVFWDEEKKELSVTINPFFYKTYLQGRITYLEITKRMKLKGSISKALYRFVQSHRDANSIFQGNFLNLADALNMDRDQPAFKIRQNLKNAINELKLQGILTQQSEFYAQDIVKLFRSANTLPPRNQKSAKIKKSGKSHQ